MTMRGTLDREKSEGSVRLSMNVPAEVANTIKSLARERGTTVTNVVKDAIAMEKLLTDEKRKRSRFVIEDENGANRRELIIR